jgi:cation/acetate symporter
MITGLLVCGYYMANNQPLLRAWLGIVKPLSQTQWFGIEAIAAGVFGVPMGIAAMVLVSLLTAPPGPEQQQLIDKMRFPRSREP